MSRPYLTCRGRFGKAYIFVLASATTVPGTPIESIRRNSLNGFGNLAGIMARRGGPSGEGQDHNFLNTLALDPENLETVVFPGESSPLDRDRANHIVDHTADSLKFPFLEFQA